MKGNKECVGFIDVGISELKALIVDLNYGTHSFEYSYYRTETLDFEAYSSIEFEAKLDLLLKDLVDFAETEKMVVQDFYINMKSNNANTQIISDEILTSQERIINQNYLDRIKNQYYREKQFNSFDVLGGSFWRVKLDGVRVNHIMDESFLRTFNYNFSLFYSEKDMRMDILHTIIVKKYKKSIKNYTINSESISKLLLSERDQHGGCVLMDIGKKTTELSLYKNEKLIYLKTLAVGAHHITQDIMSVLDISYAEAERLKVTYNNYLRVDETQLLIEFPRDNGDRLTLDKKYLESIICCRLEDIFELIQRSLVKHGFNSEKIPNYILTGGTSEFKPIVDIATRYFEGVKVKRLRIVDNIEWSDLNKQGSTALVGMSLRLIKSLMKEKESVEHPLDSASKDTGETTKKSTKQKKNLKEPREPFFKKVNLQMKTLHKRIKETLEDVF